MEEQNETIEIGKTFHHVAGLLRNDFAALFADLSLQPTQCKIFFLVAHHCCLTPISLAKRLNLTRATVTEHLNYLEKQGYIIKEDNALDKRSKVIALTEKGQRLTKTINQRLKDYEQEFSELFNDEEKNQIKHLTEKITDYFQKKKRGLKDE